MTPEVTILTLIPAIIAPILAICFMIVCFTGLWKMFTKAGKPGWGVFIPIYNQYLLIKIAGKPGWWLLLCFIPFVNFIIHFVIAVSIAKAFGKSSLFGIFLLGFFSFIGYLILGFGKATYLGNNPPPQLPQNPTQPNVA